MWQLGFIGVFDIFLIAKSNKVILLQSVTNCYYKVRQVLQSVIYIFLQSASGITKCGSHYKVRRNREGHGYNVYKVLIVA